MPSLSPDSYLYALLTLGFFLVFSGAFLMAHEVYMEQRYCAGSVFHFAYGLFQLLIGIGVVLLV